MTTTARRRAAPAPSAASNGAAHNDLIRTPGARFAFWVAENAIGRARIQQDAADGSLVALLPDGATVPADQLLDDPRRVIGKLNKEQEAAAGRFGPVMSPADFSMIVLGDPNWRVDGTESIYEPGRLRPQMTVCSSEQIRLLARNHMFSVHVCITDATSTT